MARSYIPFNAIYKNARMRLAGIATQFSGGSTSTCFKDGGQHGKAPDTYLLIGDKFEVRVPANQNAVDIFQSRWATDLGDFGVVSLGPTNHFTVDRRPVMAAETLGKESRLDGFNILELGPLEAAHTYQLEKLGAAHIVAIEANKEAFLKCLIVKEIAGLRRSSFFLGDFVAYLESGAHRFDLVFCSGVLYHSENPIHLIELISKATSKCFVWTHYYEEDRCPGRIRKTIRVKNFEAECFSSEYQGREAGRFWGGPKTIAAWLKRETILDAFQYFGFSRISIVDEDKTNPFGPSITFAAEY
jgi:hypothetical protein